MSADQPLLCGIDAGTSQVRALVFTPDGTVVASAAEPTPTRVLGPDSAELDAEDLWHVVLAVLRRVVARAARPQGDPQRRGRQRRRGRRAARTTTGSRWRRSSPGTTRAPPASWIGSWSTIGFERLHRITGLCADPTFSLLKLLWLKREAPEAVRRRAGTG